MGFATLGIFVLNQSGIEGALLVMINHGVTTGALFIAVGIIYERLHTRELDETAGLGKHMPIFAGFLGVFALSSLAFPGTNSFIGEFLVLSGGFGWAKDLAQSWRSMMICVVPGVVLAAAYNLRMLQRVAYGGTRNPDHSGAEGPGPARNPDPGAAAGVRLLDRPQSRNPSPACCTPAWSTCWNR